MHYLLGLVLVIVGVVLVVLGARLYGQPKVGDQVSAWRTLLPVPHEPPHRFYTRLYQGLQVSLQDRVADPVPNDHRFPGQNDFPIEVVLTGMGFGPHRLFATPQLFAERPLYLLVRYKHLRCYIYAGQTPTGLFVSAWGYSDFHRGPQGLIRYTKRALNYFRKETLFQYDAALIFLHCVHEILADTVDSYRHQEGLKPLETMERRPVLHAFYQSPFQSSCPPPSVYHPNTSHPNTSHPSTSHPNSYNYSASSPGISVTAPYPCARPAMPPLFDLHHDVSPMPEAAPTGDHPPYAVAHYATNKDEPRDEELQSNPSGKLQNGFDLLSDMPTCDALEHETATGEDFHTGRVIDEIVNDDLEEGERTDANLMVANTPDPVRVPPAAAASPAAKVLAGTDALPSTTSRLRDNLPLPTQNDSSAEIDFPAESPCALEDHDFPNLVGEAQTSAMFPVDPWLHPKWRERFDLAAGDPDSADSHSGPEANRSVQDIPSSTRPSSTQSVTVQTSTDQASTERSSDKQFPAIDAFFRHSPDTQQLPLPTAHTSSSRVQTPLLDNDVGACQVGVNEGGEGGTHAIGIDLTATDVTATDATATEATGQHGKMGHADTVHADNVHADNVHADTAHADTAHAGGERANGERA